MAILKTFTTFVNFGRLKGDNPHTQCLLTFGRNVIFEEISKFSLFETPDLHMELYRYDL